MKRFRGGDLLLWLAIVAPVLLADEAPELRGPVDFPMRWLQIAAVLLLGVAVALSRRRPLVAAAIPAAMALAATPALFTEHLLFALLVLSFQLGRRTARARTGLLFFAVVCLAGVLLNAVTPAATLVSTVAMATNALITIMLPWLAGRYVRQHDDLVRAGWELAERLEREQQLLGERIRLLERSRIASDMHDSLGHELSLIALRAAALQVDPALDQSARKAAAELRESAAEATQRLHQILSVLREDGETAPVLPSDDTVGALVERAAAAGMTVTLEGELERLPPMADRAAYRVVQEALTNATKHAAGRSGDRAVEDGLRGRRSDRLRGQRGGPAPRDGGRGFRAGRPRRARPAGRRATGGRVRRWQLRGDRSAAADRRSRDRAPRLQARTGRRPPSGPAQHDRRDLGPGRGLGRPAGADRRL